MVRISSWRALTDCLYGRTEVNESIFSVCMCVCVMFSLSPSSAGEDYTDIGTQVLVFDRDREFYDIMVPIIDNDIHELDEEFTASLSTEESSAILTLNPDNTVVRILDDEGT